jgi:DNA-binding NarL/FixJ family response regulator
MKVLLVEDNLAITKQLTELLQAIPGTDVVLSTPTARQASDWLASHPTDWDLAIVDLFLKEGHGFEVLRNCVPHRPGQKVVVLSNYTRDPVRQYARAAGADAFFDKSCEMDEFREFVAQHASGCRRWDDAGAATSQSQATRLH